MGGGALHDTKMIDFRYKQYPQKISGYIAGVLNLIRLFLQNWKKVQNL